MSEPPPSSTVDVSSSREEQLALLLDQVVDSLRHGAPIDQQALLAQHPELAGPLAALMRLDGTPTDPAGTPPVGPTPSQVGPYLIERELGSGGFGTVYLATDRDLKRRVALKVLHPGRLNQPEALKRFQREAAVTAQMRHAGIVQLYDYSRQGPPFYLATEFIDGVDPRVWCQARGGDEAEVVGLVARLADVIEYAHGQGVCHRDLKPANVLVDAQGQPHILDFGLARHDNDSLTPTADGRIFGSLPYMAPEQARGESHAADARSDVYSLGVILYELLTGRVPFDGPVHSLPAQVMNDPPPPPRQFRPDLSPDVEAVCLKALAKSPDHRYATAAAMAQDLRATLRGEAVDAWRFTPIVRLYRLLGRRHHDTRLRGWTLLLVVLGLVILIGCGLCNLWEHQFANDPPRRWLAILATKAVQVLGMVVLAAQLRPARGPQLTAAERQIWTLMPAYYGGFLTLWTVNWFLAVPVPMAPVLAVLSGMGFASLGATIWGWFYVWGAAFFALAVALVFFPAWGMSLLGLGWFVCLVLGGLHLKYTR